MLILKISTAEVIKGADEESLLNAVRRIAEKSVKNLCIVCDDR